MNLATFAIESGRGALKRLAVSLSVTPSFISQIKDGVLECPVSRCTEIELATNGLVTRKDLRPDDWHKYWPELR
jgi:DNA-binding transcriptional regulator YdaS (Cro superfamily)